MRTKCLAAAVAAAVVATGAPGAAADQTYEYRGGCRLDAAAQESLTGHSYEGVLEGIVVVTPLGGVEPVSAVLTCEVRVDGTTVSSTPPGAGTTVVATAGRVTFPASDGAAIEVCEVVTAGYTTEGCRPAPAGPAREVDDVVTGGFDSAVELVESLLEQVAHPVSCPVLQQLAGSWGVLTIDAEGDVWLLDDPIWECPPYEGDVLPRWWWPPLSYVPGRITATDAGLGMTWQATGSLGNPLLWSCAETANWAPSLTVTCDWVGGYRPRCRRSTATAVSMPRTLPNGSVAWGRLSTAALCITDQVDTAVVTDAARGPDAPFRYATGGPFSGRAWRVECVLDGGDAAVFTRPSAPYTGSCDYLF